MIKRVCVLTLAVWSLGGTPLRAGAVEESGERNIPPSTFEGQVRSILKAHCFQCHGEDQELAGNLDLRAARLILQGGDSGPAVVRGKPDESLLIDLVQSGEMPKGKKKLSDQEIVALRVWIEQGAATARPETGPVDTNATEEEKSFWSFQPVRRPQAPTLRPGLQVRTPVDAFLLARLEREDLGFSPEADKLSLVRRAYFDLVGLPPAPEAVDRFLQDEAPDAWEKLIDRLLASPQYGERWGRHWLDVAGYADSDGNGEKDAERKFAYKYRDYVVRSLNEDKPFDTFLREQLAGDEMVKPPYETLPPEDLDKLVATGFLRMIPDATIDATDQGVARNAVMAETIKVVSTSLLGLSVGCAQCHNHRYEPISQVDYYRFRAIFEPAYDWKAWLSPPERLIDLASDADRKLRAEVDSEVERAGRERSAQLLAETEEVVEREINKLAENVRDPVRQAYHIPAAQRTPEQVQLLKQYPEVGTIEVARLRDFDPARFDKEYREYGDRLATINARRPKPNYIQALTEVPGKIPATFVFIRGDHEQPRDQVQPAELTVLCGAADEKIPEKNSATPTSGRRLAYAQHLTTGRHPLVARVLVNRVWLHHFGRGIVGSPADFGTHGERPTHPELLDWLADEFVSSGWRLKHLHKLIMTSTAYRQSSRRSDKLQAIDPDNILLGRMNVRRLEAEVLRDAMLASSGRLNLKIGGPPVPVMPNEVGQIVLGVDTRDADARPTNKSVPLGDELYRRSLYVQIRRTMPFDMFETFDGPVMTPNCTLRSSSTVTPQSLLLMNNELSLDEAAAFAARVEREAGAEPASQVRRAWRIALAAEPSDTQLADAVAFLATQRQNFADRPAVKADASDALPEPTPASRALAALCQALLSSNGFLYVD